MSNARFSILQSRAVEDKRISNSQFRTLAALGVYGNKDGWCFPKLATLAQTLGKSRQAVSKDIQSLVEFGYVEVKPQFRDDGSRQNNLYRILFDTPQSSIDTPQLNQVDTPSTPEIDTPQPNAVDALTPHYNAQRNAQSEEEGYRPLESSVAIKITAAASGMSFIPPSESARVEQLTRMVEDYGYDKCLDALKYSCNGWKNTKGKNGRPYRITNMGWVDWAQDILISDKTNNDPKKPQPVKIILAGGQIVDGVA